jgi:hypothetical protein
MPTYKQFRIRHPEYDATLWAKCRAFYAGGDRLLGDQRLMKRVFPKHLAEKDFVYKERIARAFYIPYAGEIIDAIVAALFGEPLTVESEQTATDEFYDHFYADVSPPAGRKMPLNELLKQQLLTALLCRQAWTLVDLPDIPPDVEVPDTLAAEEGAGLLDAYACPLDPEMVLDWEETEDGELIWALVLHKEQRRGGIDSDRSLIREEYTLYTANGWTRYAVEYKVDKEPQENAEIEVMDEGDHSFGRVPLIRLDVGDGLWAMSKILPIAVAHFNLRNALFWAQCKSLFPVPVSFLGEEEVLNPATADPNRSLNQVYGQGQMVVLGKDDRFEYIGPDSSPYAVAIQDLAGLRDEMHRVLHHMALSVENSAAALQRSAESKQIDQAATATILRALGQKMRDHAVEVYEMVAAGRGDEAVTWTMAGMERFNEQSIDALVDQAGTVDTLSIPSATFQRLWTFMLARRLLGDNATEDDLDSIQKELEENVSNEQFVPEVNDYLPGSEDEDLGETLGEGEIVTSVATGAVPQKRGMSSKPAA